MSAVELDLTIPLRDCTPWCVYGDRHADAHPDDRWCWSERSVIPMRRMKPVKMGDGEWWHDRVEVELRREAYRDETLVVVWREDGDEMNLTLEEAAELRDALTKQLGLA